MHFKNGKVKVELAKGKQLWDKRENNHRTADKEARDAVRGRKK